MPYGRAQDSLRLGPAAEESANLSKHVFSAIGAAIALIVASPASVAGPCPNGEVRTSAGKCVEGELSSTMRQRAIEMSQPKISETAGAIAPAQDRNSAKTGDLNRYELNKGNFSTNPTPAAR